MRYKDSCNGRLRHVFMCAVSQYISCTLRVLSALDDMNFDDFSSMKKKKKKKIKKGFEDGQENVEVLYFSFI